MAFVNQSEKKLDFAIINALDSSVGPGKYDRDTSDKKQTITSIFPRKNIPFNAS